MTNTDNATSVLVIGGGIAGLTAAVALRRVGLEAEVFEQAAELRDAGTGLTLWSNATGMLRALGFQEPLQAVSAPLDRGEIRSQTGRLLAAVPLDELGRRMGAGIVGVHRSDLMGLLADAADGCQVTVHLGARLESFEQDSHGVTARFADGRTAGGDISTRTGISSDLPAHPGQWHCVDRAIAGSCIHPKNFRPGAYWSGRTACTRGSAGNCSATRCATPAKSAGGASPSCLNRPHPARRSCCRASRRGPSAAGLSSG